MVEQGSAPATKYKVVDLDGDGVSEIFTIKKVPDVEKGDPSYVTVSDISIAKAKYQLNFSGPISAGWIDIDEDGTKEIVVSEQRGNTVFVHLYDSEGRLLKQFPTVSGFPRGERPWHSSAQPVGMLDANGDGRKDLVLRVYTDYAYQPRGIWVYDYREGELIWSYATGAAPGRATITDLDGDGQPEILLGSLAPDNGGGEKVNGTDDSHSYLFILDARGRRLVQRALGGVFSTVYPAAHDMDRDGDPEILVLKCSRNLQTPEENLIAFWDFRYGRMYRDKEFEKQLTESLLFIDSDGDGVDEFLTLWVNGVLELRNLENNVVQRYLLGEPGASQFATDLKSDGEREIVVSGRTAIYIFSKDLALLAKFPAASPHVQQISTGIGGRKGIFLVTTTGWYRLELRRNYVAAFRVAWPLVVSFLAGGGVALAIGLGLIRWRNKGLPALADQQYLAHPDRGIITIDQDGIVRSINHRAREILCLHDVPLVHAPYTDALGHTRFTELPELIRKSLAGEISGGRYQVTLALEERHLDVLVTINPIRDRRGRRRGQMILLEDVTALAQSRRAIAWAAMAQRLAHEIKTPLSSIMLAVQRLQMEYQREDVAKAETYDRYVNYVSEEVCRLREVTDGFMKLARLEEPDLCPRDLNAIVQKCLQKLEKRIPEQIEIKTDLATTLPRVNVDENQLQVALAVLLENGIEAIEGNGKVTITTRLAHSLQFGRVDDGIRYLRIEIADTGRGIPPEACEELFEPFFTTKESGTGLGLTIAKKIIEDHRGTIEVKSEAGIGTVICVTLPVERGG
jgi:PAS domain S-box-containing protein